jgi:uncharacterized membrane protein
MTRDDGPPWIVILPTLLLTGFALGLMIVFALRGARWSKRALQDLTQRARAERATSAPQLATHPQGTTLDMIDKDLIQRWLTNGTITQAQADPMLADLAAYKTERSSNKFVVAISTIGSLFIGIGAILFVAANWAALSNEMKVFILLGSTLGAYFAGYTLQYEKQTFPKVGASLIFLGALLFGATVFLTAQIYNVNANHHSLVLLWMVGVLPLVYAFASAPIAGLSALLFYLWIGLYIFRGLDSTHAFADVARWPILYLVSGVLLFAIGTWHYVSERLADVARTYRLAGIKVAMLSLFILTFKDFFKLSLNTVTSDQFTGGLLIFSVLALLLALGALYANPAKSSTNTLEHGLSLGLVVAALTVFWTKTPPDLTAILFNLIVVGLVFVLLYVGYNREDMKLVNIGMFWLGGLVLVRYFDFFWQLLPRSLFFLVGGLILVFGGMALEKKRRELRTQFSVQPAA